MLGKGGRPAHVSTVHRWCDRGVLVGGRRVKLGSIRLPSGRAFTHELVDRFVRELQGEEVATRRSVPSSRVRAAGIRRCVDREIGAHPDVRLRIAE